MKWGSGLRLLLAGGLILALTSVWVMPAEAPIITGSYVGTGSREVFITGLTFVKAVEIVELAPHGPGVRAYTTDEIQAQGLCKFLNGDKLEGDLSGGICFDVGNVVVTHQDFIQPGHRYAVEARGD